MSVSDDQLSSWTKPWFNNEEERAEATRKAVRSAIDKHPILKGLGLRVFAKGSYPNNTNVRKDSDIDIAVELQDLISINYNDGISDETTGLRDYTGISRHEFKSLLGDALVNEFGSYQIDKTGNKVFRIRGSDKIMDSDVIPCTTYRNYYSWGYRQGIKLILNKPDGKRNVNYPDTHLENGVNKNTSTSKRFKSVVRILKNANKYLLENENLPICSSFMIECLAYNINDSTYLTNGIWRNNILYLCEEAWNYLETDEMNHSESSRWLEINGYKYLFHDDQVWTRQDAKNFVLNIYNFMRN